MLGFPEETGPSDDWGESHPMKRQPVITGLGIVSPIGIGIDKFWTAALAGRSGIGRPTMFDASKPIYLKAMKSGLGAKDTAAVCAVLEKMAKFKRGK